MLLTEEEAKTKWCHRTMGFPADEGPPYAEKCCGSMCMAWREWRKPHEILGREIGTEEWVEWAWDPRKIRDDEEKKQHYTARYEFRDAPQRGFCGLAGKVHHQC